MPNDTDKLFIQEQDLLLDGYQLGKRIVDSKFRPDFMVGIWRGGSSVGIVVQECLQYFGIDCDHISIRTSYRGAPSYHEIIDNSDAIRVHGLQYLFESMNADDRFLIVDDVYSSGLSIAAVITRLEAKMRRNMPRDTRVAVPWYKPARNQTGRVPDYFIHETDRWLVLPYELSGLTVAEIRRNKPGLEPIFDQLQAAGCEPRRGAPEPG